MAGRTRKPAGRGDYEVGYGRPPVATRFVKGVSGNPGGRPKSREPVKGMPRLENPMQDALLNVMAEMVECEVSPGRKRRVPRPEALVRELVRRAGFDPRSFKHLEEMYRVALSEEAQARVAREEKQVDTVRLTLELAQLLRSRPVTTVAANASDTESFDRPGDASGADTHSGVEAGVGVGYWAAASRAVNPSRPSGDTGRDECAFGEALIPKPVESDSRGVSLAADW